jgi:uncharacterized protein (TIGR02271 family)
MSAFQKDDLLQKRGQDLYDASGDKIGKIEEIYLDADTGAPEWALVNTGLFGTKSTFVPLRDATDDGGNVRVPYEKAQVKDAPSIESRSDSGLPEGGAGVSTGTDTDRIDERGTVGHDTSGPTTDQAMTRSEEELRLGKTQRETGRARLRKYVVEDQVTETVPVQREEVRIEREPITDANIDSATEGPAISDEEHEVVLHEEEVVAEKRAVPKERIRLDKDTVTDERQVSETVRKEEIDVDDQSGTSR